MQLIGSAVNTFLNLIKTYTVYKQCQFSRVRHYVYYLQKEMFILWNYFVCLGIGLLKYGAENVYISLYNSLVITVFLKM